MVCSMAFGKCLRVQSGMDSSGGSWESPYDWVRCGSTTWAFALVPSVPDSSRGFANQTHRESTYSRAWMLSSALTTASRPSQKTSSKVSSVSPPTRTSMASTLKAPFMTLAAFAAVRDLGCPTFSALKRNWRLRFETSMRSMSVTVALPFSPQQAPISAMHLRYSQPSAPAPTTKSFMLLKASWNSRPSTAIWSSYRLPSSLQSTGSSLGTSSNMSK
mmetsp:Transcript_10440/g.22981  ORF Transcript_10440/g.22981 Transcript_10440/m.22981 type:complete len:217 (-) Transcript_10440:181-831(-)